MGPDRTAPESAGIAEAFADGDSEVVEAYFREQAGALLAAARRIAPSTIDAEDLLSDAVTSVFAQWSKGVGPRAYIKAYIVQSMRNRVKDELRSPRSRTRTLEFAEEVPAEPSPMLQSVELTREMALLQKALRRLPEDQAAVLRSTVVDGLKPRELEEDFGRPAAAITALAARARQSLRRAMLQTLIADGTAACKDSVRQVPNPVPVDVVLVDSRGEPTHFATCAHCRRSWARFAAIPSALGLGALLILGDAFAGPVSTAAAAEQPISERPPRTRRRRRRDAVVLGAGAVAIAAAALTTLLPLDVQAAGPVGDVEVVRQSLGDARIMYSIRIRIESADWYPQRTTFTGPSAIEAISAPEGWSCTLDVSRAVCESIGASSGLDGFVIEYTDDDAVPAFELQVIAVTADGATVTVDASGAGSE